MTYLRGPPPGFGNDLVVSYTSVGRFNQCDEVVLKDAPVIEPFDRGGWVEADQELFGFQRGKELIFPSFGYEATVNIASSRSGVWQHPGVRGAHRRTGGAGGISGRRDPP